MDIFDEVTTEDLTPDLQILANQCGMDTLRTLLRNYGGLSIYIPRISRLDNFISKYLNGNRSKSMKQLAVDLGVSEQFVRGFKRHRLKSNP